MPKTKFYEHGRCRIRASRTASSPRSQRITWAYKLAESTINLPGSAAVPEIQVFEIDAKGDDVSDDVLAAIDKAVQRPIIFEVSRGDGADGASAWSPPTSSSARARRSSAPTSRTEWQPADRRASAASDGDRPAGLYAALLEPLMPVAPAPGEERVGRRRQTARPCGSSNARSPPSSGSSAPSRNSTARSNCAEP